MSEQIEFFNLEPADLDALAGLRGALEQRAGSLVEQFYQHLLRFPETQALLRQPALRERLFAAQREYLVSLSEPRIDADYIRRRAEIGTTHERVGLDTRWYLGAYSLYFSLLQPVIETHAAGDLALQQRISSALVKRLLFDTTIAIQQYVERRESDLLHLNRELTEASRALSREVDETSRDLLETQARARAAEELASVATLVSGLAHEIGTPMGVLRGHAEALETAVEGERAKWRLQMILAQIDRITSIIQSLLNIARPKESLRIPVDLGALAEESVKFLAEKIQRCHVEVALEVEPHAQVRGDPEKLQQVFLNLYINALDSMTDGGTLRISVGRHGDDSSRVRIEDTGTGIPSEVLGRVFDPFFTTKAAGHGSGLGLMVVKGLIEEHGGRIEVTSLEGAGTTVQFRLPAALAEALLG